jgi:hypothetical protein
MTTLATIAPHFNMPIKEAARKLNICQTVLKKICRDYGIQRWPARRVLAIERQVGKLADAIEDEKATMDQGNPLQRKARPRPYYLFDACTRTIMSSLRCFRCFGVAPPPYVLSRILSSSSPRTDGKRSLRIKRSRQWDCA